MMKGSSGEMGPESPGRDASSLPDGCIKVVSGVEVCQRQDTISLVVLSIVAG